MVSQKTENREADQIRNPKPQANLDKLPTHREPAVECRDSGWFLPKHPHVNVTLRVEFELSECPCGVNWKASVQCSEVILDDYVRGKSPRPTPSDCYAQMRSMMVAAWQEDFRLRPKAQELHESLGLVHSHGRRCSSMASRM